MNVAVTGATGFVGRDLAERLGRAGHRVQPIDRQCFGSLARKTGDDATEGEPPITAILNQARAVVHLAARVHRLDDAAANPLAAYREVNVDGTLRLARAAVEAGVRRFVFISSIKVNGESTEGAPFTEQSPPQPVDPYGISKWEAEQGLRTIEAETGLEVVTLRPPLVYGAGVKANFRRLLSAVDRGVPLPLGAVHNRRSLVYVGNLSDAIVRAVEHPDAPGETFLVSDGDALSTAELVRAIARTLDRAPRLLPIPPKLLFLGGRMLRREAVARRLLSSLEIDSSHIRQRLLWTPPYSVDQGLTETAAWWRAEGRA